MQAVELDRLTGDLDRGDDGLTLHLGQGSEVRQDDLAIAEERPTREDRIPEVLFPVRQPGCRVVDVVHRERARDALGGLFRHLLQEDEVGIAQVRVGLQQANGPLDLLGVLDVEGHDAQRSWRRARRADAPEARPGGVGVVPARSAAQGADKQQDRQDDTPHAFDSSTPGGPQPASALGAPRTLADRCMAAMAVASGAAARRRGPLASLAGMPASAAGATSRPGSGDRPRARG